MPKVTTLYLVGCVLLCLHCDQGQQGQQGQPSPTADAPAQPVRPGQARSEGHTAQVQPGDPQATPATLATGPAANPFSESALAASQRFRFSAVVQERLMAGGYLYLRVQDGRGQRHWVATLGALAPDDDEVSVWVMGRAERFLSKRLGREFAPLLFATVR